MEAISSRIAAYLYKKGGKATRQDVQKNLNIKSKHFTTYADRMSYYTWAVLWYSEDGTCYLKLTPMGEKAVKRIFSYYYGEDWEATYLEKLPS